MAPRKNYHHLSRLNYILLPLALSLSLSACNNQEKYHKSEGVIWNTLYHITFQGPQELTDSIIPLLNEVGTSLSVFDKNSLISRLNESDSVISDRHLSIVYDESLKINKLSNGNFDPTLSPLIDAWGYGLGHTPNVDTLRIDSIMEFIGITKTARNGNIIKKEDSRTKFNFSAIAKGYACDALGEMFKRNGVENFMIEIGGELSLSGVGPTGDKWHIGIDSPEEGNLPGEDLTFTLAITDMGVATSGNYRNFRNDGGMKTAHTISPQTGRPVIGEILSATVLASNCMEADALATACMAGSVDDAKKLLKATGAEGLFILSDTIWTTSGFNQYVISTASEPGRRGRN